MRGGWYNENANRSYPLQAPGFPLEDLVVDFGCLVDHRAAFLDAQDTVLLQGILRQGTQLQFVFRSSAAGLAHWELVFTRNLSDPPYTEEFAQATPQAAATSLSLDVSEAGCPDDAPWQGFLVTGDLSQVTAIMPTDGWYLAGLPAPVEPATIQNLAGGMVRSLSVANADRTRATSADGCRELPWTYDLQPIYVQRRCLQGPLLFQEGYNATIDVSSFDNRLTFHANRGGGEGQPCEEVPVFPGETPPAGATTLSGALRCNEVIRTISGVGGRQMHLLGALGVRVTEDPQHHRLIVDADFTGLALCSESSLTAPQPPEETSSSLCGPE